MDRSPKEEVKYLEGKLKQNPDSILFARLADVYLSMNKVDDAIQICEKGLKKHPYYVTGHYIISKCYLQKKQLDHAEKELKRVLLFDPQYIAAHRDYGDLMAQIGWTSTCESSYEKILEIDPLNKKAHQKLAEIKEKLQQEKETEKELDIELGEFEEEAIVTDDSVEDKEPIEPKTKNAAEELEQVSTPKNEMIEPISDEDEERFSYILDDIFREDNNRSDEDSVSETKEESKTDEPEDTLKLDKDPDLDESMQTTEINKFKMASSEDDDFHSEILEKWLEKDKMPDNSGPQQTEKTTNQEKMVDMKINKEKSSEKTVDEQKTTSTEEIEEIFEIEKEPEPIQSMETDFVKNKEQEEKKPESKRRKDKIVTPTLGEIYTAQHQYAKAIGVYEILRKNNPDNPIYQQKIEYLKKKLEEDRNLGQ